MQPGHILAAYGSCAGWSKVGDMYFNDIIVMGRDAAEMLERLSLVFNRLCEANLKLKPFKCCLF